MFVSARRMKFLCGKMLNRGPFYIGIDLEYRKQEFRFIHIQKENNRRLGIGYVT